MLRYGAKNAITIANPCWTEKSVIFLMRRPNSVSGSFSELLLIPKAQDAMTSVVNLAIVSFTSTAEPSNRPWYCYRHDFHLLILKFDPTLTLSLSSQTSSAPQIRECSINKLVLMLPVCQNSSIKSALFVRISLTGFKPRITLHNFYCQPIIYYILHAQLFLSLQYLDILHTVYLYHSLDAAI